ncbi:NADH-ubiquinone oxidoreductase-F iron-sulfur binding region domain-containing protein [Planctomycetota bacterium]
MAIVESQVRVEEGWDILRQSGKPVILVGTATCGRSAGALSVLQAFRDELKDRSIDADVVEVGCMGPCYAEPLINIVKPDRPGICYGNVTDKKVVELIEGYIINDDPLPSYALGTVGDGDIEGIPKLFDTPAFKRQKRRVFRNCGFIAPTNIDHYIANNGYNGLIKALDTTPVEIVEELKKSGLRGRGGGGFPAGRKWEACLVEPGDEKYVVCNADEGDPGAFMDRSLLEGDPHSLLEGMIIAGHTVGARKGYIYVRAEYPLAVERLQIALEQARQKGFLGEDILDSGFSFDIEIFQGAGAFVCGESTALTLSIEGKRGIPKAAPRPRTTAEGLFDKPTLLNNVKTFSSVPLIITQGADWFAGIGTDKSSGTAIFALTGQIVNCGLIEVPMGITLREIIYEIGGGISGDRTFKAVQTGGPSGGCLPASLLDTPIDYDSLTAAGSIMGSGGMVVMAEDTCMVDVARYFLDFTEKESCGQCVPCRLGTKQMLDILEDITQGRGKLEDIDLLVEIGEAVQAGSLCGLGQSAANPVLTTVRYFRDEYEAHINDRRCPAKACRELISYGILVDKCKGCQSCLRACPVEAITGEKKKPHIIDQAKCIRCGVCLEKCPTKFSAVECVSGQHLTEANTDE